VAHPQNALLQAFQPLPPAARPRRQINSDSRVAWGLANAFGSGTWIVGCIGPKQRAFLPDAIRALLVFFFV
jgi:hypothetical protein